MTQTDHDAQDWTGRTVRDRNGGKLGKLTQVLPATGGAGWGEVRSMSGRRRLVPLDGAAAGDGRDLTVPVDRASVRSAPTGARGDAPDTDALHHHYTGRGVLADARVAQRERFGGMKIGAAFFGWIVAIGMTVLLGAIAAAIAAAIGATVAPVTEGVSAGLVGLAVALVVLLLAYYSGGYVAGRLARFDGARNGALTWLIAVLATVAVGVLAAVLGPELAQQGGVALPTPVTLPDAGALTAAGVVTLVVIVLGTLLAAVLGGRAGEGFHRRVDRVATAAVSGGPVQPAQRSDTTP